MKKQRIVLASVLKPVDVSRMFEKIGKSLTSVPDYEIFIIGYPSLKPPEHAGIRFIPHPIFNRLSLRRLLIPLLTLKKIFKVKPDVLIVNTHELLIVAVTFRILFGTRIIYDVQENYWRNILWTDTFPPGIRHLLAFWVRGKETLLSGFFHLFILAEKGFEKEMKFFKNNFIVLENKSCLPEDRPRLKSSGSIRLLFTGTISESTGVFQAIDLARALHQVDNSIHLHLIGYCAEVLTLNKIRHLIHDKPYITLTGGEQLVPHEDIINELYRSDFGIICYPSSPHTENKIPTKLYEYLSARLPIIMQDYKPWLERCYPSKAAIPLQFDLPLDAVKLLDKMKQSSFYTSPPTDVTWSSEEGKLLHAIGKVLA
jgi:glycosyltransferase involved in cell wall biosynthesis